jgi:hypothetical protein
MRHQYTQRTAAAVTILILLACIIFAIVQN